MCLGGGPSRAEKEAAADQRVEADIAKREEIEERAKQKREDIAAALEAKTIRGAGKGGKGKRSLITAATTGGYMGRFD